VSRQALMDKFSNQTFSGSWIVIDGHEYVNCRFEKCKIVYCGASSVVLNGCLFDDCEWTFDGPAARTVQFMTALYAMGGGAQQLIEQTFDNIRGKPHPRVKPN
jgi:hypothetical protein